jgi:hypothetical protein
MIIERITPQSKINQSSAKTPVSLLIKIPKITIESLKVIKLSKNQTVLIK